MTVLVPLQLSFALAVAAQAATAVASKHCMVSAVNGTVTTGGVLSFTVNVLVAVPIFPHISTEVKVTSTV